jgi:protein subunit release factor B
MDCTTITIKAFQGQESHDWMTALAAMYKGWAKRHFIPFIETKDHNSIGLSFPEQLPEFESEIGSHRRVFLHDDGRRWTVFATVCVNDKSADRIIRSYVTHPYLKVTDYRSKVTAEDVDMVFNGQIDRFIGAIEIQDSDFLEGVKVSSAQSSARAHPALPDEA